MVNLIKSNTLYLILVTLFLVTGFITLFFIEKGEIIFLFNANRNFVFDFIFKYGTKLAEGFVIVLGMISLLFVNYRYSFAYTILVGIMLAVSSGLKSFFQHPRPFTYFNQEGVFDQLDPLVGIHLNQGLSSFPSGHTMAGFAFFGLLAFFSQKPKIKLLCFLAALIVGLSRIYLIQHFLEDVVLGATIGTLLAILMYLWQDSWNKDLSKWYNQKLGSRP